MSSSTLAGLALTRIALPRIALDRLALAGGEVGLTTLTLFFPKALDVSTTRIDSLEPPLHVGLETASAAFP